MRITRHDLIPNIHQTPAIAMYSDISYAFVSSTAVGVSTLRRTSSNVFVTPVHPNGNHCFNRNLRRYNKHSHLNHNAFPVSFIRCSIDTTTSFVPLSTGIDIEVIRVTNSGNRDPQQPIVFVHGSKHAAWAFKLFQPFFASRDFDTYSISLRGNGGTMVAEGQPSKFSIDDCVQDMLEFLQKMKLKRPIIIAHSIGGFVAQKVVYNLLNETAPTTTNTNDNNNNNNDISIGALILLASSPPSGNSKLVWRVLRAKGLGMTWDITRAFVTEALSTDSKLCKKVLFSVEDDEEFIQKDIMPHLRSKPDAPRLDTRTLTKIPALNTQLLAQIPQVFVVGGSNDVVVDKEAVQEAAHFWNGPSVIVEGAPHNLMLYKEWERVADIIHDWISTKVLTKISELSV